MSLRDRGVSYHAEAMGHHLRESKGVETHESLKNQDCASLAWLDRTGLCIAPSRPMRLRLVAVVCAFTLSCAASPQCAAGRVCGATTWAITDAVPVERMVFLSVIDVGVPGETAGWQDALGLRQGRVFLRFDLSSMPQGVRITRALLSLSADGRWRPSMRTPRVDLMQLDSGWTPEGVSRGLSPSVRGEPVAVVELAREQRSNLRVDVTNVVRAWAEGSAPAEGLAIECDDPAVVFTGPGALSRQARPRIEVEAQ